MFGIDRELLEQAIEEETTTVTVGTTELTDAETLEVADELRMKAISVSAYLSNQSVCEPVRPNRNRQ